MARTASLVANLGIGAGVGTMSGALGVGGGIILVPYLVLRRKLPQKQAQATSLVMVALAAGAGAVTYWFHGQVAWVPGLAILAGGLLGAFAGSHLVQRTADRWLQGLFGAVLMIAAVRMLWPTSDAIVSADQVDTWTLPAFTVYVATGLGMGFLSAMFGIGGGILLVPVLVTFLHYTPQLAAGTSLAVMLPIALFGAYRQSRAGLTDWQQGAIFGLGSMVGAIIGATLAVAASAIVVRLCFAAVMLAVGARFILASRRPVQPVPDPS